jgi:oligoendopeptidase F
MEESTIIINEHETNEQAIEKQIHSLLNKLESALKEMEELKTKAVDLKLLLEAEKFSQGIAIINKLIIDTNIQLEQLTIKIIKAKAETVNEESSNLNKEYFEIVKEISKI